MRCYYDLHLHSCLSPCADEDMTPYNLVQMAALNELNIIALTDHNSCKNCPAAMEVSTQIGITLLPGMELCTQEEIHMVCLFPALEAAMAFDRFIYPLIPDIPNRPEAFGSQQILSARDEPTAHEPKLLVTAANIGIGQVPDAVRQFGGVCFPAHIDRASYSILAALGDIPAEYGFTAVEISARGDVAALQRKYPLLRRVPLLLSSDAHYLEDIHPRRAWLELPDSAPETVLRALDGGCAGFGRG